MSEEDVKPSTPQDEEVAAEEAAAPADADPEDQELDVDADALAAERDSYRTTLQQVQADFENYRKRMIKQQTETAERANEALIQKLLPVLDTIDLAKTHEPSGSLEQIAVALLDVLSKEGLERIPAVEQPFDPTLHEAVAHEEGADEPRVNQELRAGYRWKGRVVRPAMVTVIG